MHYSVMRYFEVSKSITCDEKLTLSVMCICTLQEDRYQQ
jgi:hypothetical protein